MRRIQASTGAIAPMHRIAESPPRRTIVVETTGAAGSEAAPASEAESEPTPPPRASISDVFRAYLALTKPRIVELLLITTVPAMFLAARLQYNALPHWLTVVAVVVAGALAAGSANAINCYIDRDIDHLMRRTQRRPIPQHTVQPRNALIFGLIAGTVSVVMIGLASNLLAAALTLGAIVYYDVVYTIWLKRTTAMNTVWGGVCGSAPVLIGWAAVTGTLSLEAWILFAVVFLWQPPHFFALAIKYADDYAAAGIHLADGRGAHASCRDRVGCIRVADVGGVTGAVALGYDTAIRCRRFDHRWAVLPGGPQDAAAYSPGPADQADAVVPLVNDVSHIALRGGRRRLLPGVSCDDDRDCDLPATTRARCGRGLGAGSVAAARLRCRRADLG